MEGQDLVRDVTCDAAFDWVPVAESEDATGVAYPLGVSRRRDRPFRVAAYDLGMKWNILRRFTAHGCEVRVFPATAPAERPPGLVAGWHLLQQRPG